MYKCKIFQFKLKCKVLFIYLFREKTKLWHHLMKSNKKATTE